MHTKHLDDDEQGTAEAAKLLTSGALVAFPTETVFGLGADARNGAACAGIFTAKGRPRFNPLIVHVLDVAQVEQIAVMSPTAHLLAKAFWPGPLTLVLTLRDGHGLSPLVSAGLDTVAVRVPAHPTARRLLADFGGPVAAPSANPSGWISPTRFAHVRAGLDGKIAAILDGVAPTVGLESTILRLEPDVTLLREGGIAQAEIEAVLGTSIGQDVTPGKVQAPGQLSRHYAPHVPVVLDVEGEVTLGFGDVHAAFNLSPRGDVHEAAANLFQMLHAAEQDALAQNRAQITVSPIPMEGLGAAINDRLKRAASPY